jgi:1-deoxy-D-xylulose-5-phosphate reductoisomerase
MGIPDMRIPILYALSYPDRYQSDLPRLDLSRYPVLTFSDPDTAKFRNLALAYYALKKGGNLPCIMNAANEVAVNAFLAGKIGFLQMSDVVEFTMEKTEFFASPGLSFLETSDKRARTVALNYINELYRKS